MRRYFVKIFIFFVLTLSCACICYCFAFKVKDDRGRENSFSHPPERIVSLAPCITETLFALRLDEKIVGLTTFCDYPPKAQKVAKVGSYIRPNIEMIIALEPDLVLATMNTALAVKKLEELKIPVFIINPQTLRESLDSILSIGRITGRQEEAVRLVSGLNRRIKAVVDKTKDLKDEDKPSVFWQLGSNPLVSAGPQTFSHDLICLAGGRNIAGDANVEYPRYGLEGILHKNPDVIIVVGMTEDDFSRQASERWSKWENLSAVKNSRIYRIDLSLVTRPGSPRGVEGLEKVSHLLHPELTQGRAQE